MGPNAPWNTLQLERYEQIIGSSKYFFALKQPSCVIQIDGKKEANIPKHQVDFSSKTRNWNNDLVGVPEKKINFSQRAFKIIDMMAFLIPHGSGRFGAEIQNSIADSGNRIATTIFTSDLGVWF